MVLRHYGEGLGFSGSWCSEFASRKGIVICAGLGLEVQGAFAGLQNQLFETRNPSCWADN